MRWVLGSVAGLSFSAALALTGYLGWVYWEDHRQAELFHTAEASEETQRFVLPTEGPSAPTPDGRSVPVFWTNGEPQLAPGENPLETVTWLKRPKKGSKVGTLRVPSIGAKIPMWSGVDEKQLSKGVGIHDLGLPGESDTVALAGHRETAFKQAGKIKTGDRMILETKQGTFHYQVRKTWITDENDRSVVVSTGEPVVKAYTCFPFDAPDSPQRYVIEAELIE